MLTLLQNARIRTMNASIPSARAAVIEDGRFVFVGSKEGARLFLGGREHSQIDAQEGTVVPGFHDSHLHFSGIAAQAGQVELRGAGSIAEILMRLKMGMDAGHADWLIARGWNQDQLWEKRMLTRADLDEVSADIPMLAVRVCGHIGTLNSAAMALTGIADPDGIAREEQLDAAFQHVPMVSVDRLLDTMADMQHALLAKGITSIQSDDCWVGCDAGRLLKAIRDACDDGRLVIRYAEQARAESLISMQRFLEEGLHTLSGNNFKVSHLKLIADGSLGARTAWLRRPYADEPETRGSACFSDEEINAMVTEASANGMPVAIHAIGDAAMQQALDAIADGGNGMRHAIVHAQIMDARQMQACMAMKLSLLVQPVFLEADALIVRARVGDVLADTSYRWRSLLGGGANIAFGTDCPVEPFDPMVNLYCAVTRHGPRRRDAYLSHEGFSMDEALHAYTVGSAIASGDAAIRGCIWPGMQADFAILNRLIDGREPGSLLEASVAQTYIDGRLVYSI